MKGCVGVGSMYNRPRINGREIKADGAGGRGENTAQGCAESADSQELKETHAGEGGEVAAALSSAGDSPQSPVRPKPSLTPAERPEQGITSHEAPRPHP